MGAALRLNILNYHDAHISNLFNDLIYHRLSLGACYNEEEHVVVNTSPEKWDLQFVRMWSELNQSPDV